MPVIKCLLTELNTISTPDPDQTGYWVMINKPTGLSFPFNLLLNCGSGFVITPVNSLPFLLCSTMVHNPCIDFEGAVEGDYVFRYNPPLGSCGTDTSDLTVCVNDTPTVGISCEQISCEYSAKFGLDGADGCFSVETCDNSVSPLVKTTLSINGNCTPPGTDFLVFSEEICSDNNFRVVEAYDTGAVGVLGTGDYIYTVGISYDNGTGTETHYDLDVSPTSAAALHCCGCAGPHPDLIWNTANPNGNAHAAALRCTIERAIFLATGVPSTPANQKNYVLTVTSTKTANSRLKVFVSFWCAHVESSPATLPCGTGVICGTAGMKVNTSTRTTNKWVGCRFDGAKGNMVAYIDEVPVEYEHTSSQQGSLSIGASFNTGCGTKNFAINSSAAVFDLPSCRYNTLVISDPEICGEGVITNGDGGGPTLTCNSTELTASPDDCGVGTTFLWSGPGLTSTSTNPTSTTASTGTISVTVTCPGCIACSGSSSIALPCT